jgi:hypothetical protein
MFYFGSLFCAVDNCVVQQRDKQQNTDREQTAKESVNHSLFACRAVCNLVIISSSQQQQKKYAIISLVSQSILLIGVHN